MGGEVLFNEQQTKHYISSTVLHNLVTRSRSVFWFLHVRDGSCVGATKCRNSTIPNTTASSSHATTILGGGARVPQSRRHFRRPCMLKHRSHYVCVPSQKSLSYEAASAIAATPANRGNSVTWESQQAVTATAAPPNELPGEPL